MATKKSPATVITSFRLSTDTVAAATRKAKRLGVSRRHYIEQLLRKDLGLGTLEDLKAQCEQSEPSEEPSIFG